MWPEDQEDKTKMIMPGDNVEMMCEIYNPLAIESGQRFNVRGTLQLLGHMVTSKLMGRRGRKNSRDRLDYKNIEVGRRRCSSQRPIGKFSRNCVILEKEPSRSVSLASAQCAGHYHCTKCAFPVRRRLA